MALPLKEIRITSEFGPRTHPITGEVNSFHGGLDFGCTPSDDILSVKDGNVVEANHSNIGYGNYVTVQHGDNEFSRYAHLSSIAVSNGQSVNQGDFFREMRNNWVKYRKPSSFGAYDRIRATA